MQRLGRIVIVSGPSGVGKGTIINEIRSSLSIPISVSATTREPRKNEVYGLDYYFLSDVEFEEKVRSDSFLEWAKVHGHYYGTLKSQINAVISTGQDILLEIDVQGAQIVLESNFPVLSVFLLPPSFEALERRLLNRASDSLESIQNRINQAKVEILEKTKYDYIIVNDKVKDTVSKVLDIIKNKG